MGHARERIFILSGTLATVRNEPSPNEDGELVHETCPEDEVPKVDEQVVAETHSENFIDDVEDETFETKFSGPSRVFQTKNCTFRVAFGPKPRQEVSSSSGETVTCGTAAPQLLPRRMAGASKNVQRKLKSNWLAM
ncbi:hypothetical protein IV203_033914 [Nitzschia inconspicua]|uniref:Uncharacterized protein n=1 Tax=Nitzschia inconspicua TaxID=303405 RepID=A0A9K3M379_9STRA|nr:hypothetical protein IV203_033914 [Nitzschia inconspicua]